MAKDTKAFWQDLHTSLRMLKTDYIDLYQFHNPLAGGLISNARAAWAFEDQFDYVLPIWGIQREAELDEFISFMENPPAMDDALRAVIEQEAGTVRGDCRGLNSQPFPGSHSPSIRSTHSAVRSIISLQALGLSPAPVPTARSSARPGFLPFPSTEVVCSP